MVLDNGAEVTKSGGVELPELGAGASGDAVKSMQLLLMAHGFGTSCYGRFDERTEGALVEFQKAFHLVSDGRCGADTWRALLGLTGVG